MFITRTMRSIDAVPYVAASYEFMSQDLRISPLLPDGEGRDEGTKKENSLFLIPLTLTLSLRERGQNSFCVSPASLI
jgi:hypothetical protein